MNQIVELLDTLPAQLAERVRVLGRPSHVPDGPFVLYWMRTAIRAAENQALAVATEIANRLNLPLLVYQGLSERYPYASDRHHTFVLEGARDVQSELANQNTQYVLHVDRPGHRGPHLKTLAGRAAAVVTEELPTEPLRSWTELLVRDLQCALLAVDTACVVPMQLVGQAYDRAFAFRNAIKQLYRDRVTLPDHHVDSQVSFRSDIELPFEPVDLQVTDIASLVSECEIDHSIGPVPHTRGGSQAGYCRWQKFQQHGLSTYDRRRNNALVDGVSRMSAYFHYGMVAPTRIAREVAAVQGSGAEKYLDELFTWRELAYAFCFHRRDHGRLSALPNWARQTLSDHQGDPRELLSWETMARGRTGDSIWDSAQRSLLIHGELHNNVRMTWGKAVLQWTPDAKCALARLIDLNHRYALDGRDPASYGGILWCLGQFDRPFSPPQPVFGTVRTRPTSQQAKRLDPVAFRRQTSRSLWDPVPRIAVIGAGISGLTCARILSDHGCQVSVFEKSRGLGGRMSTRRIDESIALDHGAQYFTARDKRFKRYVTSWQADGIVEPWAGRIVRLEQGQAIPTESKIKRYVAVPGMNALGKHLADDLAVCLDSTVSALERTEDQWRVVCDRSSGETFDVAVLAVPTAQAIPLLSSSPRLIEQVSQATMKPCWALMLVFRESLDLDFDGAFVNSSPLSWIARDNSKPGRSQASETWVVHSDPDWAETHLDVSPDDVRQQLISEFLSLVDRETAIPSHTSIHRWRFAIPQSPITSDCLFDAQQRIGACGDWCGGPRVEGAFLSGMSLAGRILGKLNAAGRTNKTTKNQLTLF